MGFYQYHRAMPKRVQIKKTNSADTDRNFPRGEALSVCTLGNIMVFHLRPVKVQVILRCFSRVCYSSTRCRDVEWDDCTCAPLKNEFIEGSFLENLSVEGITVYLLYHSSNMDCTSSESPAKKRKTALKCTLVNAPVISNHASPSQPRIAREMGCFYFDIVQAVRENTRDLCYIGKNGSAM